MIAVLAVFFLISGEETTSKVPYDSTHRPFYDILAKTGSRLEAEKSCESCHNGRIIPFPKDHPSKNRCLFCHKMKRKAS
jgi:hypothetical protein